MLQMANALTVKGQVTGAHAAVLGCGILTRDARRYRHYFPRVKLISPA